MQRYLSVRCQRATLIVHVKGRKIRTGHRFHASRLFFHSRFDAHCWRKSCLSLSIRSTRNLQAWLPLRPPIRRGENSRVWPTSNFCDAICFLFLEDRQQAGHSIAQTDAACCPLPRRPCFLRLRPGLGSCVPVRCAEGLLELLLPFLSRCAFPRWLFGRSCLPRLDFLEVSASGLPMEAAGNISAFAD